MNDTPQEKSPEAEGGSPIWMIVCMVVALFAASYFVRSNTAPTDDSAARARTISSETPDDIMPAAFKDHLPWNPNAKGVIKGNMGLQYIVLKEGRKRGKNRSRPTGSASIMKAASPPARNSTPPLIVGHRPSSG